MSVSDLEALRLEALAHWLALPDSSPQDLGSLLRRRLLRRSPHLGIRIAQEIVKEALDGEKEPLSAIETLSRCFIRWTDGQPSVEIDRALRHVRCLLDEDLLLAATVAWQGSPNRVPEPVNPWHLATEPLCPVVELDLAEILDRPLAETHLHLWGAAPPLIDWLPLMLDLVSIAHKGRILAWASQEEEEENGPVEELTHVWIERLAEAALLRLWLAAAVRDLAPGRHPFWSIDGLPTLADLSLARARREGGPVKRRTAALLEVLRGSLSAIGYRRPVDPEALAIPGCPVWIDPGGTCPFRDPLTQAVFLEMGSTAPREGFALGERFLLASALRIVRSPMPEDAVRVLSDGLLRYIRTKNAFVQLLFHRGGIRGLDRFRSSFGRRAVHWRGGNHRARQVWSLAIERYWTQIATLRWLQASTTQPLLPGPVSEDPLERRGLAAKRFYSQARLPDLERKLELRVTPALGADFGRTLHAQAQGLRYAMTTLSQAAKKNGGEARCGLLMPRFQVGLIFHLRKDARTPPELHAHGIDQIFSWLRDHPGYQPLIVGLDAASSELDQPPSDFVPAFRKAFDRLAEPEGPRRSPLALGMTFHVGEDFRDLLTGIRQVDMVLRLLQFRPGDRLGHALALGLDPVSWYQRQNGKSHLRIGDHLLDLLWAHHVFKHAVPAEGDLLNRTGSCLTALELRDLDEAQGKVGNWLKGRQPFEREKDLQMQLVEHMENKCSCDRLHEINVDSNWLAIVSALQAMVARAVAKDGLYIEANPSSNLSISGLSRLEDLPLFRQHPVSRSSTALHPPLRLSLSTDDPGLFHSGLREEYVLLLKTALETGSYAREEVLTWLDRLRAIGYDSSFLRGRALPGEHFLEYLRQVTE
ncbi:MAG TPA: hypothetical protein VJ725_10175 [Thermoanaerobaculia bacterium]|nr:hypothetical protein [Thermoanaerobaculia bacterium]